MINAAFRLPTVSLKYLYDVVMDARTKGVAIDGEAITKEIRWREESHGIDGNSAYASSSTQLSQGMPSLDAASLPPLVASIQPGTVASFPLKYNHAESYLGEGLGARTVLVGDAAHTVHPLAGQGLNQGLADVECLSKCIAEAVANGGDVGESRTHQRTQISSTIDRFLYGPAAVRARAICRESYHNVSGGQATQALFHRI